ncbi:hypothetical protein Poli38472_002252 [Pythium oligandrum]|uniref:Transmembrane protein n=1 Tax=Pythium oligandrum TaxID=41045 RepID=A0A8K1CIC5_PYTOL|nr:hypothetical protein Poli38472_002252 [Pythium oligandrum]|eukprot:TMW63311.1 hypothetical protein Poli38472_002252 [Pythium oligandrum]
MATNNARPVAFSPHEPNGRFARDDLHAVRPTASFSPRVPDAQQMKSFTTDDLPSSRKPLLSEQQQRAASDRPSLNMLAIKESLRNLNTESVVKFSTDIVDKVKKQFTLDESERILREDWILLETEDHQLAELKEVVKNLEKAFQFSKSSALVNLATETLKRCESVAERSSAHIEQTQLMFSTCSNEILTLQDYLNKLREAIQPPVPPRDKVEEKKLAGRAKWAATRMIQSVQSMVTEMRDSLAEIDDLIIECSKLMVQTITLLHMRNHSADFSGTGVAVGAAGVVAGALVGVAGLIAAPVTGGLSVPISVAGKGLFFSGVAALTPSTIMLTRHSQQLDGLARLIEHLKSRLEIMNQKRVELSTAFAACEDLELNVKQAGSFCQDALDLEISAYENVWPFVEPIYGKLTVLDSSVTLFLTSPSLWHFCKREDSMEQYIIPEEDE